MFLRIPINNKFIQDGFIKFIIKYIRMLIYRAVDRQQLSNIQQIINEVVPDRKINAKDIIVQSLKHLTYSRGINDYVIYINTKSVLPGTNISLSSICKSINYGTLSHRGYPVYDRAFNEVSGEINTLLKMYLGGL